jgi:predicted RNA-binding Zn-ribbon protein involved in translation (DUF1610 family)
MRHKLAEEDGVETLPEQLVPPFLVEFTCPVCGLEQARVEITRGGELMPNPAKQCVDCGFVKREG